MKRSSAAAAEIRDAGMRAPANGWPVADRHEPRREAEKSPARMASVGTVAYWSKRLPPRDAAVVEREGRAPLAVVEPRDATGPPTVAPNDWRV
jgi:hypothetical protein